MSREQWGNGYWRGVKDAQNGTIKSALDIEALSKFAVLHMCKSNLTKTYDQTLFKVSSFIAWCHFCGIDDLWESIYEYILRHEPLGAYVSGDPNDSKEKDWFCLPWFGEDEEEIDRMLNDIEVTL